MCSGVPFLRRVVKRHLGEQAARGITVRTGIMALAASFIDQELYEIYPPPPGGEGEEALQLQDEWLTEGKFLVSFDLLEDEEIVDRIMGALGLEDELDPGTQALEDKIDVLAAHQAADRAQLVQLWKRGSVTGSSQSSRATLGSHMLMIRI